MRTRSWSPAFAGVALFMAACQLAIGDADLNAVQCKQDGVIGAPACASGQICTAGRCVACAAAEVCNNGQDDNCDGQIDEGCVSAEGGLDAPPDQSSWPEAGDDAAGGSTGGTGGVDASAGSGGVGGGDGGSGGIGGTGDTGGLGGGGTAGDGGAAGSGGGDTGGTGGSEPTCKPMGASCMPVSGDADCCNGYCCTVYQAGKCYKNVGDACNFPNECCTNKCTLGYCSLI